MDTGLRRARSRVLDPFRYPYKRIWAAAWLIMWRQSATDPDAMFGGQRVWRGELFYLGPMLNHHSRLPSDVARSHARISGGSGGGGHRRLAGRRPPRIAG
jgi:hypothetical protein